MEITDVELKKTVNLINDSTVINTKALIVLNDIIPLLKLFQDTIDVTITEFLKTTEDASLKQLLDDINGSVADNIAIMENKVPLSYFEKAIPMYDDQLYRAVLDEINCRSKAYDDFKSRRNEVKEVCFNNRFGPALNKLTTETQNFIKVFIKFLRDEYTDTVSEFKLLIQKWTTDIPIAVNCGVTGCIDDYIATNKNNVLNDINIGHTIKDLTINLIALFPGKEEVLKTMIAKEFNGIYQGIKECYK